MDREQQEELALADGYFEEGMKLSEEDTNGQNEYDMLHKAYFIYIKYRKWGKSVYSIFNMSRKPIYYHRFKEHKKMVEFVLEKSMGEIEKKPKYILFILACTTYVESKEYEKAIEYGEKGLLVAEELNELSNMVVICSQLGTIYSIIHIENKAFEYYFKALNIAKKNNIKKRFLLCYDNLGKAYLGFKQLHLSRNYLKAVIYLFEEDSFKQNDKNYMAGLSVTKGTLGEVCVRLGKYTEAQICLEDAIAYRRHNKIIDKYNPFLSIWMGILCIHQEKWKRGENFFKEAIAAQKKITPDDLSWFVNAYFNIVEVYLKVKKWTKAFYYLEVVKKIIWNIELMKHYFLADYYLKCGIVFVNKCSFKTALEYLQNGIEHIKKTAENNKTEIKYKELNISILKVKVYLLLFKNNTNIAFLKQAIELFPLIDKLIQKIRSIISLEQDSFDFNQKIHLYNECCLEIWYELFLNGKRRESLIVSFLTAEKSKVHGLLSTLKNTESLQFSDIPSEKLSGLQQIQIKMIKAEKRVNTLLKQENTLLNDKYAEELLELKIAYHQYVKELEEEFPNYLQSKNQLPKVNIEELQKLLKPKTALIEYEITKNHIYIFCLSSSQLEVKRRELSNDFEQLLNNLLDKGILGLNRKKYVKSAYQAYQLLIEPIVELLQKESIQSLHIIPDLQLLEIPFEAFLTSPVHYKTAYAKLPYLLQDYTIRYHYSATLWAYQQKRTKIPPKHQEEFMGFAPVYHYGEIEDLPLEAAATRAISIGGMNYQALVYSEKEVQDIQASFAALGKTAQIHLREKASLQNFKERLRESSVKYLHIAAHSVLNEEEKELLGILFSPMNPISTKGTEKQVPGTKRIATEPNEPDVVLHPNEVTQLQLESDLVFLSCCKSGIGKLAEGEGMLSINRNFLYAGVPNIVFTLFKIYDEKTPMLTQHFYEAILEDGKSYSEALQYAKCQMIKKGIAPKFWSGFLLLGE